MRSLRYKLLLSFGILLLGMVALGGWSVYHFAVLGRSVPRIMADNYRSVLDAQVMKEALERQDSAMMFRLAGAQEKAEAQYRTNRERFRRSYEDAAANITEIGEQETIDDIGREFEEYVDAGDAFLASGAKPQRETYFRRLEPAFLHLKQRCDDLLNLNQAAMIRKQRRAEQETRRATQTAVALATGTLLLGVLYSFNLSRRLVAPLTRLTEAARHIGQGDLDQRLEVHTGDEVEVLAEEFNRMTGRLSEYREREAARLQVAEQQAEAAINHLYEPVVVTGPAGDVVGLNRAAESLFGPEPGHVGRPVEELNLEPLTHIVRESIQRRLAVAPESERGLVSVPVDHAPRCYRLRTAPLLRASGEVAGTVTVLEDVTRLREVDRLKDEFISVASHELRTPLTSMQMAVRLLAEQSAGPLTEKQERLVRMAIADAERLDRLTHDLLDLTRLEAGTAVPNRRPVNPLDLVDLGLRPLYQPAAQKEVVLSVQVAPGLHTVSGDVEQLARVVSNLAGNAVRHTPSGGRVEVSARLDQRGVLFEVSDTGSGIPADYVPRIFERFVQVPGATSGGAGLGLPISRKIVEAHGGAIWVESPPGEGAHFFFTVPTAAAESRPAVLAAEPPAESGAMNRG